MHQVINKTPVPLMQIMPDWVEFEKQHVQKTLTMQHLKKKLAPV